MSYQGFDLPGVHVNVKCMAKKSTCIDLYRVIALDVGVAGKQNVLKFYLVIYKMPTLLISSNEQTCPFIVTYM